MSEIKVNSIKGVGASAAAITVNNTDGTCTANITNNLSNRNLIINGAMQVAQRGTSSTSSGHQTVDRFAHFGSGWDNAMTQSQVDVSSGTTPYTLGFRKAFKLQNGNQTSGAGAGDAIYIRYRPEAQDIASSGWNYTSTSSFITLSFWVKSSVAQNFFGVIETSDGTQKMYPFQTGSLTADTWTKVTKIIPGHADLTFNMDNGQALGINWMQFMGTDYTANSAVVDTWKAQSDTERMPDNTSTWYTTNDATFEITGVQLEVGSVATDFEHRSFVQELALCQRYFYKIIGTSDDMAGIGFAQSSSDNYFNMEFPVPMRDYPTLTGSATPARFFSSNNGQDFNLNAMSLSSNMTNANPKRVMLYVSQAGTDGGLGGALHFQNVEGFLSFSAEL